MGKVTGPLFGIRARNQIAKTLVYFPWKGVNAVRGWVKPAYTNSAAQQTVRADFKALITVWHSAVQDANDKTAWERDARTVKYKPQSGFNRFVGWYRHLTSLSTLHRYLGTRTGLTKTHNAYAASITSSGEAVGDTCIMYYGHHPSSMYNSASATYGAPKWSVTGIDTGLPAGAKFYTRWVQSSVVAEEGRSGIYEDILT